MNKSAIKQTLQTEGWKEYAGPCIIKVEAIASTADLDGQSDFDLVVVDN